MKAAIVSEFGEPNVIHLGEFPTPTPAPNEVLVRLQAAALNHIDIWVRTGNPAYSVKLPHVMGTDGAGVVEMLGSDVEGVSEGDRVLIMPGLSCDRCLYCRKGQDNQCDSFEILGAKRLGTYAEFVAVPDTNLIIIPDNISFETAAAFPVAYLTAWHMLKSKAKLAPKETVLIQGGGSGVSIAAIQIAKHLGARVLASTTNEAKIEKIKAAGAEDVFMPMYGKDLPLWVRERTDGEGVDVAMDHVGPATWDLSVKALSKYGRLVTCGATTGPAVNLELRSIFGRDISIFGARMGTQKEFQEVSTAVFAGKIKPIIDRTFPLEEAAQAHAYMEAKQQVGKILLKIS
jgi:NADPH:quinone reductase-like Zn-dependent oxidoreductase